MPPARAPPPLTPAQVAYIQAHLDEDQGPRIVAISILLIVLSVVSVLLRFIARNIRKLPWQIDDYFMLPALFFTVALCVKNLICVHFGNGKHIFAVGLPNGMKVLEVISSHNFPRPRRITDMQVQGIYFLSVTYGLVHFFIKLSILLLYRRIFANSNRAFVIGLRTTMIYVTAWSVATVLVCIFQCTPISFFWKQALPIPQPGSSCIDITSTEVSLNILNTVGDIATLLLPALALRSLKMSTGRKIAVASIFMIGLFAVAAGIARIFMVYRQGADFTWDDADLVIWTAIEPAVGILCACFPVIAPAFSGSILKKRFGNGPAGSLLRKVFRSGTSQKSKSDNSIPLSFVSSAYTPTKDKASHPFTQLRDPSDKENRIVVQTDLTQFNSFADTRQLVVPEYETDGALPALPHETVRTRSDADWVAKYPHRQV